MIPKTSGKAKVAGYDVEKEQNSIRKNIGIVFQDPSLDDKLTGRENLDLHAILYNMPNAERLKKIEKILKLVELEDKANVLVENYSGGMRRRLEIGRGLLHDPRVLFLDEPTLGLDVQTRRKIWDYIKKLNREHGVTLILTTHYIEEADYLCDRVAFIDHGKIVALDTPAALKSSLGGDVVSLELGDKGNAKALVEKFRKTSWIKEVKQHDHLLDLSLKNGEMYIPEIIKTAEKANVKIMAVHFHKPSLEDAYVHFTGTTIRETEGNARKDRMRMHVMRNAR